MFHPPRSASCESMRRYYITDRRAFPNLAGLLQNIGAQISRGIEMIQIREKDLPARELTALVREAVEMARGTETRILVNSRADVALVSGAHGIHLPSYSIAPSEYRRLAPRHWLIGVSCHSVADLRAAQDEGADFAVFSPIFPSAGKGPAVGLDALREAVQAVRMPVFALGGITEENSLLCVDCGAAGIAGISLFQP